jgi:hypothetical protein
MTYEWVKAANVNPVPGQTETEGHTDAQEEPGSDSSSLSEFVSHVDRDINTQQPPVYSEHDDVPEYDNIHQAGALPQVLTYTGVVSLSIPDHHRR